MLLASDDAWVDGEMSDDERERLDAALDRSMDCCSAASSSASRSS